jgi:hypothetical protein
MTSRRLRRERQKKWKILMAHKNKQGEECTNESPHFIPPSFGDIGFFTCNVPDDLTNHTHCRPPYDHESNDHIPESWFVTND